MNRSTKVPPPSPLERALQRAETVAGDLGDLEAHVDELVEILLPLQARVQVLETDRASGALVGDLLARIQALEAQVGALRIQGLDAAPAAFDSLEADLLRARAARRLLLAVLGGES